MSRSNYQVPDFQSLKPYQKNHYEIVAIPIKDIGSNRILMAPIDIPDDLGLPLKSAMSRPVNMVISNIDINSIRMNQPHICMLKISPKSKANGEDWVALDSALPISNFAVHNIVEKAMQSWRFDFARPAMKRIYANYGEHSFMMLNNQEDTIKNLANMDEGAWKRLLREWSNIRANWYELRVLLNFGFDPKVANFIIDSYRGSDSISMNRHPFRLAKKEVGSQVLNRFFRAMSVNNDGAEDFVANSIDFLDARGEISGATSVDIGIAVDGIGKVFSQKAERTQGMIIDLIEKDRCDYRSSSGRQTVSMGTSVRNDMSIGENIARRIIPFQKGVDYKNYDGGTLPDGTVIHLNDDQKTSVHIALTNKTSVITGGPGTGKTTTAKSLIREISQMSSDSRVFLAAPTGKAARRMSEVTGLPCTTMHRMLGMAPGTSCMLSSFGENDTLIIDEMSMVDLHLFANTIRHIGDRGRLVLLGDSDQLASVESGDVLNDLIQTRRVPVAKLSKVQRQAAESNIVMGSYSIMEGSMPNFGGDLHFIKASSSDDILVQVKKLIAETLPQDFGITPDNVQILSSQRVNKSGVYEVNREVKDIFNPGNHIHKAYRQLGGTHYHVGDRVMYLKNRYDKDVQNGECGIVHSFDEDAEIMVIEMDQGKMVKMPYADYQEVIHAWASTVHKSQGSEYDCVIFVMPKEHLRMLTRNLIFTAMTRGKKHVFFVAEDDTLSYALRNNAVPKRRTHLSFLVAEGVDRNMKSDLIRRRMKNKPKPNTEDLFKPIQVDHEEDKLAQNEDGIKESPKESTHAPKDKPREMKERPGKKASPRAYEIEVPF